MFSARSFGLAADELLLAGAVGLGAGQGPADEPRHLAGRGQPRMRRAEVLLALRVRRGGLLALGGVENLAGHARVEAARGALASPLAVGLHLGQGVAAAADTVNRGRWACR